MSNAPALTPSAIALSGNYEQDLIWGDKLREADEALQWLAGDYLNAMRERYEGTQRALLTDIAAHTGVAVKTLEKYALVARTYSPDSRESTLSYTHYSRAVVAENPVATVRQAAEDGLSVRDTERLARGLPLGGEDAAQAQSSSTVQGASLEEAALEAISLAERYLQVASATIAKPGFRLTVAVGQDLTSRLRACAKPFRAIEDAIEAEVGSLS